MDMVRRLKRSSAAPPTMPMAIWGTAQMSASVPAASASPVVASKMSGSATAAMEFPSRESAFDTRKRMEVRPNMRGILSGEFLRLRACGASLRMTIVARKE